MSARFLPPRSPTPGGSRWRRAPEAVTPPALPAPASPPHATTPPQPGPGAPSSDQPAPEDDPPRRHGVLAQVTRKRALIAAVAIGFVVAFAVSERRWSAGELQQDLTATLERFSIVADEVACDRHDQQVTCAVLTSTAGVPPRFVVDGEIEEVRRVRRSYEDGDVGWEIPSEVLAP